MKIEVLGRHFDNRREPRTMPRAVEDFADEDTGAAYCLTQDKEIWEAWLINLRPGEQFMND
jgi:hypothetical protein